MRRSIAASAVAWWTVLALAVAHVPGCAVLLEWSTLPLLLVFFSGLIVAFCDASTGGSGASYSNPGRLPNSPHGDGEKNWKKTPGYRGDGIY